MQANGTTRTGRDFFVDSAQALARGTERWDAICSAEGAGDQQQDFLKASGQQLQGAVIIVCQKNTFRCMMC